VSTRKKQLIRSMTHIGFGLWQILYANKTTCYAVNMRIKYGSQQFGTAVAK